MGRRNRDSRAKKRAQERRREKVGKKIKSNRGNISSKEERR
jgi:hypothetical protein